MNRSAAWRLNISRAKREKMPFREGLRVGSLVLLQELPTEPKTPRLAKCKCDCGRVCTIRLGDVMTASRQDGANPKPGYKKRGVRSCGCFLVESHKRNFWKGDGVVTGTYFRRVVRRAESQGYECHVGISDLSKVWKNQGGVCAITGIKLFFRPGKGKIGRTKSGFRRYSQTNASLDRVDSKKGYVVGNIQWVHKVVNKMKLDHDQEAFVKWCRIVVQNHDMKRKLQHSVLEKPR